MSESPELRDQGRDVVELLLALPESACLEATRGRGWPVPRLVRDLKDRAFALLRSDPPRALALAALGLQLAPLADDGATSALAERGVAQALHAGGRYAEALPHYERAAQGFAAIGDDLEAARSRIGLIEVLMYVGRYADAMDAAQRARATFAAHGDDRRAARIDVNLGNVLHRLDRPAEALNAYDQAYAALERFGDEEELALIQHNRGNVLAALNRFEEALAAYAAAGVTCETRGLIAILAQTSYNQAYLHFLRGQFGAALAGLAQVRRLFTDLHDRRHLALCDLDEAEILLSLNRGAEAQILASRATDAFDALGMRYEGAKARLFHAVAALEQGDRVIAGDLLSVAGDLFAQEGNIHWSATVQVLTADLALRRGEVQRALDCCERALAQWAPFPLTARAGRARVLRGQALRLQGQIDAAFAAAQESCRDALLLEDRMLSHQAHHLLGLLHEERGDLGAAATAFRRAMDDVDWLRDGIAHDDLRISFVHDKVALYEDAVRNALRRRQPEEAFEHVERARARALVDLLAGGPAIRLHAGDRDARAADRLVELRAGLSALYGRLHGEAAGHGRSTEGIALLVQRMRRYEHELRTTLAHLQAHQADYVSLGSGTAAGLHDVRAWLQDEDVLLEYYLLDDAVLAFVVTRADVQVVGPLASRGEIEDLVLQWRGHLAQFRYGADFAARHGDLMQRTARSVLRALHARLMEPLAAQIARRPLVIVPHGPLHHVPFHALFDGSRYLIEDHDISYVPSATAVVVQGARRRQSSGALVVGVPTPALPHIAEEVRAVAACHRRPRVLLGESASRASFLAAAAESRSIHLASHAIFRADDPLSSAVQLADQWLTVADVYELDLAADLVVLSACETGSSSILRGDEMVGMTRSFLYAGARTLVTSLWAANDAATAALMAAFHRAVAAGNSMRHALCAAQRQTMCTHPHPYYWAPFSVCGQIRS